MNRSLVLLTGCLTFMAILGSVSPESMATVYRVPADFTTLQDGINAAGVGDTVLVAADTYTGSGNRDLDFGGVDLVLLSESGPQVTIIDCEGTDADPHRAFYLHTGETNAAVIEGFTIQHGRSNWHNMEDGAGIHCDGSSPTIRNCVVTRNIVSELFAAGGGFYLRNSSASVEQCLISHNWATYGAGIACRGSTTATIVGCQITENEAGYGGGIDAGGIGSPRILECWIAGNDATNGFEDPGSGGGLVLGGSAQVLDCTVTGNLSGHGAGIACWSGSPQVIGCTIAGNDARDWRGGGVSANNGALRLERSILWGNCAAIGREFLAGFEGVITLECCVYDSVGAIEEGGQFIVADGNLNADPLFCAAEACENAPTTDGGYTISRSSPAFPENHPCGSWIGAQRVGCPASAIPSDAEGATALFLGIPSPNPAWEQVSVRIALPTGSWVTASWVDVAGRRLETLFRRWFDAGEHDLVCDWGDRARGQAPPNGVYFLTVEALGRREARAILVAR